MTPNNSLKALLTIFIVPLCFLSVKAQDSRLHIEKEPSWVTISLPDYNETSLDMDADDGYIDMVYEKQVSISGQSVFYKRAIRVITESGVEDKSKINIRFDPAYSSLILHTIKIIRGNTPINKLDRKKIKLLQEETELPRHIYNGDISAVLFLEDVRKGDIIEYSYTIRGFNPTFKGRYTDQVQTRFSVPLYHFYYKVLVPKGRSISIRNRNGEIPFSARSQGNDTSYEWKFDRLKPLHMEDRTPDWFDPYPVIMVSEYHSWKEVAQWASQLFPEGVHLSNALNEKIGRIRHHNKAKEDQLLETLRFVQDEVRYMGIEMGENSHKPHPPDMIFKQRFGDCKDKSYLLCIMLNALGIEAKPVLINTDYKKEILNWLPSPSVFDHATVRVRLNEKYYWFDPTINYQRGSLASISYPDYRSGLVVDPETTSLSVIPLQDNGTTRIQETFTLPDMSGKAHLEVRTIYSGSFADGIRSSYYTDSRYGIQKSYREYYASYYENIVSDSITFHDDESGSFTTLEYYTINDLWKYENKKMKAHFDSYVIDGIIKKPADLKRTMPFNISFPARYVEDVTINLPEKWESSEYNDSIVCGGFKMLASFSTLPRKVKLHYELNTGQDYIAPDAIPVYLKGIKKFNDNFGYELSKSEDQPDAFFAVKSSAGSDKGNVIKGIAVIFLLGLITWMLRKDKN